MSLKGRLGKAVMKRVEAMPSIQAANERSERIGPTLRAAMKAAYSPLGDEAARMELASRLASDPEILREATLDLSDHRRDYARDRAYRLLSAAVAGTPVEPTPPERRELFAEEEVLGRMPIEQAFEQLAELQPLLLEAKRQAQARDTNIEPSERAKGALSALHRSEADREIAGEASEDRELLNTTVANSIVNQYLQQLAGVPEMGTPSASYFDAPRLVVFRSARIRGPRSTKR